MKRFAKVLVIISIMMALIIPEARAATPKRGLLVFDSIYGSTVEIAYWIKAIIGHKQQLDVKSLPQVITVDPYDYVIIGSATRNEKPTKKIYEFVEKYKAQLSKKQVCYFLGCGDSDETMVLKVPGQDAHLIAGRNYLIDIQEKYPEIRPVLIAGFGGRQVLPNMGTKDSLQIWLLEKLAKEGAPWVGLDIWESLIVERVEAFANDVRMKILGLEPRENVEQFRGYWQSLQPASLKDRTLQKFKPKPYTEHHSTDRIFYARSRIKADLRLAITLLEKWAAENGITLKTQVKTFYNRYYHAVKNYNGEELTMHVVPATMPEDPGNVHISFRCYESPDKRGGVEADIARAEKLLWADGQRVDED